METSWELRFIILLWLSHLVLTPFDLITISSDNSASGSGPTPPPDIDAFIPPPDTPFPSKLAELPQLCKTLLLLAAKTLPSPSTRESDAAALLIVRISIRRDMRALGLLEAVVEWCLRCWTDDRGAQDIDLLLPDTSKVNPLFLRTGCLKVLAGLLTQCESAWVRSHIPQIWGLVRSVEEKAGEDWVTGSEVCGEWSSAGVRKVATKICRWTGTLLLYTEITDAGDVVEDVIELLLKLLGDRDTNVRFAASKSLGVLTSKLPPEMASEVVNAIVEAYDEDVLNENEEVLLSGEQSVSSIFGDIPEQGQRRNELLVSVSPEKWHGLTLTLAAFLRQRVIKPPPSSEGDSAGGSTVPIFQLIIHRILTALTFDQRRTTFSVGSNVRDAACYAAWALARSYYTKELLTIPLPQQYIQYPDPEHPQKNIIQLLATNIVVTACLDSLGNIRRAASAALQELIGRHPNIVENGIKVVQTVDYAGVSVRRRAVTEVARDAAALGPGYWFALTRWGLVGGRGVGSGDAEGRRVAGKGAGVLTTVRQAGDGEKKVIDQGRRFLGWLLNRTAKEAKQDVEVRHGVYWAIAEILEGLNTLALVDRVFTPLQLSILFDIFHYLQGRDFTHIPLRPELTAEASCRLVAAFCNASLPNTYGFTLLTPLPCTLQRRCLAIVEASLDNRPEDPVMEEAIPAARELFRTLDLRNGINVVKGWCRRVLMATMDVDTSTAINVGRKSSGGSGLGRKRGIVGGLGEVLGVLLADHRADISQGSERKSVIADIVDVLVNSATRQGDVELRVAGIRGINRGLMSSGGEWVNITRFPSVILAVYAALDDYAIDSRGDVGNWVRMDGIAAVAEGWRSGVLPFGLQLPDANGVDSDVMSGLIIRLVRLSVEKLDKLRSRSFLALRDIFQGCEKTAETGKVMSIADIGSLIDFSQSPDTYASPTTSKYFSSLLPLLSMPIPELSRAFLAGYVVSSGSGSDSLLKVSSGALWSYLDEVDFTTLVRASDALADVLNGSSGERVVGAALETIGAGFEAGVLGKVIAGEGGAAWGKRLFIACQKAHKGVGSMGRLVSAVRVYRGLGLSCAAAGGVEVGKIEGMVRRKLISMLTHPFPLVRREVAEGLFICLTIRAAGSMLLSVSEENVTEAVKVLMEMDWMGNMEGVKSGMGKVKIELA